MGRSMIGAAARRSALPDLIGASDPPAAPVARFVERGHLVADIRIEVTDADGRKTARSPGEIDLVDLFDAAPARKIPNSPSRLNKIGWYWSSTTGGHHQFESVLEAETLRWLDWRPDVVGIATQPLRIVATVDALKHRKHVPDILIELADGSFELLNVKPRARQVSTRAVQAFAMCDAASRALGCTSRVVGELGEPFRTNLRFGAQYRHELPDSNVVEPLTVLDAFDAGWSTVGEIIDAVGSWPTVLPVLMHLAWHGVVHLDWNIRIDERSNVRLPDMEELRC